MLKIVPPKQDGFNCGYVAACHAANYFGIEPSAQVDANLADHIKARTGFVIGDDSLRLLMDFLPGLELTLLISPEKPISLTVPRLSVLYTRGNEALQINPHEAVIVCSTHNNPNARGETTGHVEFALDRTNFDGSFDWILFLHQPGVVRK